MDIIVVKKQNVIRIAGNVYQCVDAATTPVVTATSVGNLVNVYDNVLNEWVIKDADYTTIKDGAGVALGASASAVATSINSYAQSDNPEGVIKDTDTVTALSGVSSFTTADQGNILFVSPTADGYVNHKPLSTFITDEQIVLNDLYNVAGTANDGDILSYRASTPGWNPSSPATVVGGANLNDVGDVSISSPNNGNPLVYNTASGNWINSTSITTDLVTSTGISVGATGILSSGNIQTLGTLSGTSLSISSAVSFTTVNASILNASTLNFTGSSGLIGVGGLNQNDLTIRSNGNVTVELDADNNETSQKFAVNDPSATERFSVSDTGVVTINNAFSLPSSDGSASQALQTNGSGAVSWVTLNSDDIDEGSTNLFLTPSERTAIAAIPNEFFTVSSNANTAITLASGDEGKYIRTTAATAVTVTIPSSVFSVGDEIIIEQAGAGQVTVAAGTGVTLNNSASNTAKTAEQYAVVGLKCVASNVFTLTGERELV